MSYKLKMNKTTLIALLFVLSVTKGKIEDICGEYTSKKQNFFYPFDYEVTFDLDSKDVTGASIVKKPTNGQWESFTYQNINFNIKNIPRFIKQYKKKDSIIENSDQLAKEIENSDQIAEEIENLEDLEKKIDNFIPILFCAYDDQNVYLVQRKQGSFLSNIDIKEDIRKMTPIEVADLFLRPASGLSFVNNLSLPLDHININANNLVLDESGNIYIRDISEIYLFNDINVFNKESIYTPSHGFEKSYIEEAIKNFSGDKSKEFNEEAKKFIKEKKGKKNRYLAPENSVYSLALSIVITISDFNVAIESVPINNRGYNHIEKRAIPTHCFKGLMHIDRVNCIDKILANMKLIFDDLNEPFKTKGLGSLSYGEIDEDVKDIKDATFSTLLYKIIEYTDEWRIQPQAFYEKLEQIKESYIANDKQETLKNPLLEISERRTKLYSKQIEYQNTMKEKLIINSLFIAAGKSKNYDQDKEAWEKKINEKSALEIKKYQEKLNSKYDNYKDVTKGSYKDTPPYTPSTRFGTISDVSTPDGETISYMSTPQNETPSTITGNIEQSNTVKNFFLKRANSQNKIIGTSKMGQQKEESDLQAPTNKNTLTDFISQLNSKPSYSRILKPSPSTSTMTRNPSSKVLRSIPQKLTLESTQKELPSIGNSIPYLSRMTPKLANNHLTNQKSTALIRNVGKYIDGVKNSNDPPHFAAHGTPIKLHPFIHSNTNSRLATASKDSGLPLIKGSKGNNFFTI